MMIGGICESPLTISALIEWHDALLEGKMLLRDIIDLEATYGADLAETAGIAAAADAVEAARLAEEEAAAPPAPEVEKPAKDPSADDDAEDEEEDGEARPRAEGDESEEGEEGDMEEANLSLAAMEAQLMPQVVETFEKITVTYAKMRKVQDQRLNAIAAGGEVTPQIEKKYEKLRQELIKMMEGVHLNNARIEYLVEHLNELNKRLLGLEGKLQRLAVNCKIKREDFLDSYYGAEQDPAWLEQVGHLPCSPGTT
jgi:RNA polymerase primary sigma factor